MSKLGVGIGDEFPIDDGKSAADSASRGPGGSDPDYEARRAEWHRQREAWRDQRRQWRDQWREKKRAFREEMRAQYGDEFDRHDGFWHGYGRNRYVFRLLALAGAIVIAITIFSHIYILFGLLVLAGLYFAYHRGHDFDWSPSAHPAPRRTDTPPPASTPSPSAPPAPPSDAPKA